ncbi:unnamed protein product [Larinioides sclopetarius]|uniref:Uncharacterized protein n=1 Tax=Larinioides sclopetarius TaxID=280406 RepID=A0AAV1ZJA9_9ARAC
MSSQDFSQLSTLNIISRTKTTIKKSKKNINWMEMKRTSDVLNDLKNDENRLKRCIDNIEVFHRDMFILPIVEDKPSGKENTPEMNETEYSVTEPESPANEPSHSMNEPNFSSHQPNSSNVQNSARRRLILKIPKSSITMDTSENKSSYDIDKSGDVKDEPDNESSFENKVAKQVVLDFSADKEKEITELLLHLIHTFSCFQRNLRTAEKRVSPTTIYFPSEPNKNFKRMMKSLSGSVLHMDKTVYNIHEKYCEILERLSKIFE